MIPINWRIFLRVWESSSKSYLNINVSLIISHTYTLERRITCPSSSNCFLNPFYHHPVIDSIVYGWRRRLLVHIFCIRSFCRISNHIDQTQYGRGSMRIFIRRRKETDDCDYRSMLYGNKYYPLSKILKRHENQDQIVSRHAEPHSVSQNQLLTTLHSMNIHLCQTDVKLRECLKR